jgi:hypothetical protein
MFLGIPDADPLLRGTDPAPVLDPAPDLSIINKNSKKNTPLL